jgi:50S ribosomal subunit-associated GTPase HflX
MRPSTKSIEGERVVLVALLPARADLAIELEALAEQVRSAGGVVVGRVVQRRGVSRSARPGGVADARAAVPMNRTTYIGSGKALELQQLCAAQRPDLLVFYNRLDGTQRRTLERITNTPVIDRYDLPRPRPAAS